MGSFSGRVIPDFAVIGAPKSGTTSLCLALGSHPDIQFSLIKEPQYFSTDLPGSRVVTDEAEYQMLFPPGKRLTADGSTSYLFSRTAVPAMLSRRPDLKVIALLRNPIDLFQSFHNEMLKNGSDDVEDPEAAWALQAERAKGLRIPTSCFEPKDLQYLSVCSLGEQVARLKAIVPASQQLVLLFDDLVSQPQQVLGRVCRFVGVPEMPDLHLPKSNGFARPRSAVVAALTNAIYTDPLLRSIQIRSRPVLQRMRLDAPIEKLFRLNLRATQKPALSPEFRAHLANEFTSDVALLGDVLGRDLTCWHDFATVKF